MSKAFTSEETPDASIPARAVQRANPGDKRPITLAGWNRFLAERETLIGEGASSASAPEELKHKLALVQATLESVFIPDVPKDDAVRFGCTVSVEDEDGISQTWMLVGPDELDAKAHRISIESPLAKALLGQKAGAEVEVERPKGMAVLTVTAVR